LSKANLTDAILTYANLTEANLTEANMTDTHLVGANLLGADLRAANLTNAILSNADLTNADLSDANLSYTDFTNAILTNASISIAKLIRNKSIIVGVNKATIYSHDILASHERPERSNISFYTDLESKIKEPTVEQANESQILSSLDKVFTIPIRIAEEPVTPQNLVLIFTALTELTTKFWLITKHRFADLIEYTQTHDSRFAYEAGTVITRITYNSPINIDWKVDMSAPSVAEAVGTTIDAIKQKEERLKKLELANQAEAQRIKEAEQKAEQARQMAVLDRERQELELERQRLAIEKERQTLIEQRLEAQNKQLDDALDLAKKAIDMVYPNADAELRPVLFQTVLNNILQLQNASGLQLALSEPKKKKTK
jgi:hypothetical protein